MQIVMEQCQVNVSGQANGDKVLAFTDPRNGITVVVPGMNGETH